MTDVPDSARSENATVQYDCEHCGTEINEVVLLDEGAERGTDTFAAIPSDAEVVCGTCGEETGKKVKEVL